MKTKSLASYFGSDSEVAEQLARLLDKCKHVTIPFAGGLSIVPHLTARAIVANDLHNQAINFYRHISGRYGEHLQAELIVRCQSTLSHPEELALAHEYLLENDLNNSLAQAWAFWASCWIARKGKGGTKYSGGLPSIRRTAAGGTNASRLKAAADDLIEWTVHLRRCEFERLDFRDTLASVSDRVDCGVYCDPPWIGAGDGYLHSFTEQDHRDLAVCMSRFNHCPIVVRYGDDPLIRCLYPESEWEWIVTKSRTQANAVRGEVWICKRTFDVFQNAVK